MPNEIYGLNVSAEPLNRIGLVSKESTDFACTAQ